MLRWKSRVSCISDKANRCIKNYNNDFEHECFDQALRGLGAKAYHLIPADCRVQRFMVPGCSSVRYYPHQVWGIQFVVQRIISEDGLNSCLVADDMGIGKVCTIELGLTGGI